ncbi:MAG TPA: leucyl/phenylalanyl-tRNA--protein transferase [Spirochaetota bacterium]|nr:leucyl/phenylalanyl-tRNA--protein transferase [Spirochaetota bacterium]
MPVFRLSEEHIFPPVELSEPDGLLAVGGDLSAGRLIEAYSRGIFPWFTNKSPIMWWSPDPRFVIIPGGLKVSRSMKQIIRKNVFEITFDRSFRQVITSCSRAKRRDNGTWITKEMIEAYVRLHEAGFAHSVEAWENGKLSGGLYGISLGRAFFGESMFSNVSNSSKAAFIVLAEKLFSLGFSIIDCQVHTGHLESLGAVFMSRGDFINTVNESLKHETIRGSWKDNPLFCTASETDPVE